jgi:hypothetical protein
MIMDMEKEFMDTTQVIMEMEKEFMDMTQVIMEMEKEFIDDCQVSLDICQEPLDICQKSIFMKFCKNNIAVYQYVIIFINIFMLNACFC